jgi:universal stress protein E
MRVERPIAMALRVSRILVDVDTTAPIHPALVQAVNLAARVGARVTAVAVLEDVPRGARVFVTPLLEQELVANLEAQLHEAVAAVGGDVPVAIKVLRGKHASTVIRAVVTGRADLLMRSHGAHNRDKPQQFGPIDMNLLRHCPCPVWIVEARVGKTVRRVLAAVNANRSQQNQQPLNRRIVELALRLSAAVNARLTILEVWSVFGEEFLRSRLEPEEVRGFLEESRDHAASDLSDFLGPFGDRLQGVSVELLRGEAADVIPAYVAEYDVDLVVMGTVARGGIAGLLMGNTAERVLQHLQGSVVAVKPPGFVDPSTEHLVPARQRKKKKASRPRPTTSRKR